MKTKLKQSYPFIGLVLFPIVTFYLLEFYTHNPFTTMKPGIQFLNIVFFELLAALLLFLFGNIRTALMTLSLFTAFCGLANYFVMQFRSIPIMPWDLLSFGTALSVANNYEYHLNKSAVFTLLGFLVLLILEWKCRYRLRLSLPKRILPVIAAVLCLWGFTAYLHRPETVLKFGIYDKLFTPSVMTKRDGTFLAFLIELQYMSVAKPEQYSAEDAKELLASYETQETADKKPNIIVIMDEAFSDPGILGDFQTNEDYMPFIRKLMEGAPNTISGYTDVSILGGNTPNTEFEFLTGNSMAFLPQGSVPFQQYVTAPMTSVPLWLKELGYRTVAMHPYHSTGWERNQVYPLLGIDTSYFLEDFKDAGYIRKYVSDRSCFDKIIDQYEAKKPGDPLFVFNVTMQNHSSYTDVFENFQPGITVEGDNSAALSTYLSLLKETDNAVQGLISYFEQASEDTLIVFFGDHQPTNSVVRPVWKLNGKSDSSLTEEEEALRYKVPFFIWANYPLESKSDVSLSANYLGVAALKAAGLPMPAYFRYLDELSKQVPSISAVNGSELENDDAVREYSRLQYYQIFDYERE